ncbi:hypothetical protein X747_29085 [Mesorhizobium sp. LNJC384A00]|uniref:GTP pyrophosphokinase n=1 Tax=unclassified Mesorhizobium TaxID=325217 RepID=UPI0003CE7076|nr:MULTISPECIES: RelA/SpoT domain-containing protein [unclassified Mesorhizobium]ESX20179.1 GTP pyrophosphokinase [Mesorhizobium sp. LSJC255A00]ESX78130.1 GTP pyrophosphokinase [Mesorhizobium sp. LSHC414A00]ESY34685.1 hypothetical protein X747_29085 [Mesorhizobium sp. LNJC384A00]
MTELDDAYEKRRPVLDRAVEQLKSLLLTVLGQIEDRRLVRAEFDDVRPKALAGLKRKAIRHGWTPEVALTQCPDLVGGRVICNNLEDVYRFESLLRENLPVEAGSAERQDYIAKPTDQGYRALHLNFRLNAGEAFILEMVPCEIQIRSRLQDAWAELSHADLYKQAGLPPDLLGRAKDLSRLLATAEEIAGEIRSRAQEVTEPPEHQPQLERVTAEGLAFIFKDVFGRAPPAYAVSLAVEACSELGVTTLTKLPRVLKRAEFRSQLADAYSAIVSVPVGSETLMLAGLHTLARGSAAGIAFVRERAQQEFAEVDNIARREMVAELPSTVEELIDEIDDPRGEVDVVSLADALGVADTCAACGAPIVDPYSFAEAAVTHYGLSEEAGLEVFEQIEQAIMGSGVDVGAPDNSGLCSYCAAQLAKDD